MEVWCVLVWLAVINACLADNCTLHRRKRYLNFPPKASIVLTVSLLKNIASDAPPAPTTRVVTIHELDVFFPLPHEPSPFKLTTATLGGFPVKHEDKHRRERREVFKNLQDLFEIQGYSGRSCILKTLCEAKSIVSAPDDDILMDILLSIFKTPEGDKDYQVTDSSCLRHHKSCPFSIFDLAYTWVDHYLNQLNQTSI